MILTIRVILTVLSILAHLIFILQIQDFLSNIVIVPVRMIIDHKAYCSNCIKLNIQNIGQVVVIKITLITSYLSYYPAIITAGFSSK